MIAQCDPKAPAGTSVGASLLAKAVCQLIVPTLCVGMPLGPPFQWDAERPGLHSHAERGNDQHKKSRCWLDRLTRWLAIHQTLNPQRVGVFQWLGQQAVRVVLEAYRAQEAIDRQRAH